MPLHVPTSGLDHNSSQHKCWEVQMVLLTSLNLPISIIIYYSRPYIFETAKTDLRKRNLSRGIYIQSCTLHNLLTINKTIFWQCLHHRLGKFNYILTHLYANGYYFCMFDNYVFLYIIIMYMYIIILCI